MDKTYLFQSWKKRGLICRDNQTYDTIYSYYKSIERCEKCGIELDNEKQLQIKCMDHDHITGYFRQILCWNCNINDQNRQSCKKRKDNKTGYKNISYHPNGYWVLRRQVNKKTISKHFKNKIDAICYKYILLLKIKSNYYLNNAII
jgi:hypothetical protein